MKEPSNEVKQKYMELQLLQNQLMQVQKQLQALESQASEMDAVQEVLEDFAASKVGSDMFVTLTPGLYVKAKLEANDSVLLNVGGGAVVQKNIPDAKKIIAEQGTELRKLQDELAEQMNKLAVEAGRAQEELRALVK
ncbi:Prefoldin subunit alpha [uncultured archaeon]|nr:Prefoldin subunit alpha [uncultured archaeon]